MHPFASYVLQRYYHATGWNEDNFYGNITRSSNAILDFVVPSGLSLGISKSPNPLFKTSYSVFALPSLHGSVGYIFTSADLHVHNSRDVRVKDITDHFKVYDQPRRPEGKPEEWRAGERVDTRDYLMYGKIFIPTGRLEALYTTRVTPTLQGFVAAISDPRYTLQHTNGHSASNVLLKLQHATGRWCTEYSWSAEDHMYGVQCMYNFGKLASQLTTEDASKKASKVKRVDEEDAMEGGLKGRISTGAEFYLSTKEKSAGVSAGIRFTTLPDATPPSAQVASGQNNSTSAAPSQPPTTITAMFNPMLGHMSGAYAARVSKDLSLCSRFEFNVYSYESEWSFGAEWWTRGHKGHPDTDHKPETVPLLLPPTTPPVMEAPPPDIQGVVKARLSTKADVSLMWEGRIRNMLVSLGIKSDLTDRTKPIKAIGLEMSYFSSE